MPKLKEGSERDEVLAKLAADRLKHAEWREVQNAQIDSSGIDSSARFDEGDATDAASVRAKSDADRAQQKLVDIAVKAAANAEKESGFPDGSWRDESGKLHIPSTPKQDAGFNVRQSHRKPLKRKGRVSTVASAPTGPEVIRHAEQTPWARFRIDYGALIQAIADGHIDPRDYGETRLKLRQMGTTFLKRGFPFEAAICERMGETIRKRQYVR